MLKKTIKILFKNKVVRIFLFFSFWVILTVFCVATFDTSFSIWSYNHPNSDIQNLNHSLFYRGETFKGEFMAQDNNLGIVSKV